MHARSSAALAASCAVLGLVLVGCSDDGGDKPPEESSTPAAAAPVDAGNPVKAPTLGVGQSADFAASDDTREVATRFKVTYRSATIISAEEAEDAAEQPPGGVYVRVGLTVENVGKQTGVLSGMAFKWSSSSTAEQSATTLADPIGADITTTYQPGQSVTGDVVLYALERGGEFVYHDPARYGPSVALKVPK